jgi:hypothetical protein
LKSYEVSNATFIGKSINMIILGMVTVRSVIVCLIVTLREGGVSKSCESADVVATVVGFEVLMMAFMVAMYLQTDVPCSFQAPQNNE